MILGIRWYAAIEIAGWLAFPLTDRFFRSLPDRGYTLSKLVGCLGVSYFFWVLGSLGIMRMDAGGLAASGAIMAAIGVFWLGVRRRRDLRAWLGDNRRYVIAVEILSLLAFTAFAYMRAHTPEILGTEKPMEFMFLNAILRSGSFPAHDAWLSGYAISYYHFGYIMIAALALATGTPSAIAFNLGLATLFALAALSSSGMALNLIAYARRRTAGRAAPGQDLMRSFWPGLLAPALILLVGNLYGALELAHDNGYLADLRVPAVYYGYGEPMEGSAPQAPEDTSAEPGVRTGWLDFWTWLDLKRLDPAPARASGTFHFGLDNWFFASRVIHDRNLVGVETEAIDEFPAFSFLLGDMHPHVLSLPFVFLAMALAFDWMIWGHERAKGVESILKAVKGSAGRIAFSSLILGGVGFLNFWDLPFYWFLLTAALVAGHAMGNGWRSLVVDWRRWLAVVGAILAGAFLLYLPFYAGFQSQAGGILPNLVYSTRFRQMVVMFAPLLLGVWLLIAAVARRYRKAIDLGRAARIGGGVVLLLILAALILAAVALGSEAGAGPIYASMAPFSLREAIGLITQRRLVDGLSTLVPAAVIGFAGSLIIGLGGQHGGSAKAGGSGDPGDKESVGAVSPPAATPVAMALLMAFTGGLLIIGPEYLYLRDNFGTRMNTIFKFYFQAWAMWGMATAFGLWYVWQGRRGRGDWALLLGTCLAIALGAAYTPGTVETVTGGFNGPATLDGMAYFSRQYPDDWAAILWLRENAQGSAVILEGTKGAYWIEGRSSRISMATGNPTLMGWINHESQWRGPGFEEVAGRIQDIETIYRTRDWGAASALLEKYDVEYVIISPLERDWYGSVDEVKFERHMRMAFQSGEVRIYQR
jgi:YYY domain-containing protein